MTHDPLCPLGQPCHALGGDDHLLYKAYEGLTACDCCDRTCCCDVIAKVRADMLAKCIATVEELFTVDRWAGLYLAVNALRDLQEKP